MPGPHRVRTFGLCARVTTPTRSGGTPPTSSWSWTASPVWSTLCATGPSSRSVAVRARPVLVGLGSRPSRLLAAALVEVALLRHHHLAPEDAHDLAVLVVADGLDVDDPSVVLRLRLPLVEDRRLGV